MRKTISTSLAPNLEWDDVVTALQTLVRPWTWKRTSAVEALEAAFVADYTGYQAISLASGRTCLHAILSSLDLKPEDEVLLQAYTCVAVPNPILWANAKPVFVDCDRNTLTMSIEDLRQKISPRSKVLIIQHTFGQVAALEELLALARTYNLFVIEDCAHALGAHFKGKLVGTFADASFFSFGRDKTLSSVFGGIALVKDPAVAQSLRTYQTRLPWPSIAWTFQQLLYAPLSWFIKQTYDLGIGKAVLFFARKCRLIAPPVETQEKRGEAPSFLSYRFSNALAKLALHQYKKRDRFNKHRLQRARFYEKALASLRFIRPIPMPESGPVWLRYTIQTPKAEALLEAARREHIYLGDWYRTPVAPRGVSYDHICYDRCLVAEISAKETLNLPTDIHIGDEEANRIIAVITRTL